jgi:hypothetical protein
MCLFTAAPAAIDVRAVWGVCVALADVGGKVYSRAKPQTLEHLKSSTGKAGLLTTSRKIISTAFSAAPIETGGCVVSTSDEHGGGGTSGGAAAHRRRRRSGRANAHIKSHTRSWSNLEWKHMTDYAVHHGCEIMLELKGVG